MRVKVFSVYDSKAEAYLRPMFLQTKGLALRSFIEAVNDPKQDIHRYAADFTLFELGEWDDETGTMEMLPHRRNLGCALEFLEDTRNPDWSGASQRDLRQDKKEEKEEKEGTGNGRTEQPDSDIRELKGATQ
jgi:hypothetical protein